VVRERLLWFPITAYGILQKVHDIIAEGDVIIYAAPTIYLKIAMLMDHSFWTVALGPSATGHLDAIKEMPSSSLLSFAPNLTKSYGSSIHAHMARFL